MGGSIDFTLRIHFVHDKVVYRAGETVYGWVSMTLSNVVKIKYLGLLADGRSEYTIGSRNGRQVVAHELLKDEIKFLEEDNKSPSNNNEMKPGNYIYNFSVVLPETLPYSFKGPHGFGVTYKCIVTARTSKKFNQHTEEEFFVYSEVDLHNHPDCLIVSHDEISKPFKKHCCRNAGKIVLTVKLPRRGYIANQTMPITVTVDNITSKLIDKVHAFLVQEVVYHHNSRIDHRYKSTRMVFEGYQVKPYDFLTIKESYKIPYTAPSLLENCRNIIVRYRLVVVVKVKRHKMKLEKEIVIGTILPDIPEEGITALKSARSIIVREAGSKSNRLIFPNVKQSSNRGLHGGASVDCLVLNNFTQPYMQWDHEINIDDN